MTHNFAYGSAAFQTSLNSGQRRKFAPVGPDLSSRVAKFRQRFFSRINIKTPFRCGHFPGFLQVFGQKAEAKLLGQPAGWRVKAQVMTGTGQLKTGK